VHPADRFQKGAQVKNRTRLIVVMLILALATGVAFAASTSSHAKLKTRKTSLGKIVVTRRGMTLYLFLKDHRHGSHCYKACAKAWPPLLTHGKPRAGRGIKASLLGTTRRKDGRLQVTYARHPLYRYTDDKRPGQTKGQGSKAFGANWYVVSPSGKKIDNG
jgi:predicted lipoprotein with Yx(FWY)xxD motif